MHFVIDMSTRKQALSFSKIFIFLEKTVLVMIISTMNLETKVAISHQTQ